MLVASITSSKNSSGAPELMEKPDLRSVLLYSLLCPSLVTIDQIIDNNNLSVPISIGSRLLVHYSPEPRPDLQSLWLCQRRYQAYVQSYFNGQLKLLFEAEPSQPSSRVRTP